MDLSKEGEAIKKRLSKNRLSQSWLVDRLKANGTHVDNSYLSQCLNGFLETDKAIEVIYKANSILDRYERKRRREVR